ncbi:M13 family metallopeptidase [Persicobacter diffluens]|uniref:Endothelin-converting protein n=1 Tax=Persicobacter diffluens TaxID=981 RepID=A0AAN4VVB3_9BACT|nr:endothelin-converting protein [Persicobacter diffluens]
MNKKFLSAGMAVALSAALISCDSKEKQQAATADAEVHGIDPKNMDAHVHPGEDFYHFANGGWDKITEIPDDQTRWGAFNELRDRNIAAQQRIMKKALENIDQFSGDQLKALQVYQLGMDSAAIENAGTEKLQPIFDKIRGLKSKADLPQLMGELNIVGVGGLFGDYVYTDRKNSQATTYYFSQGGLSLPDKDYYLKDGEPFAGIRDAYVQYITDVFMKLGEEEAKAKTEAQTILAFETEMAKISWDRAKMRNPELTYNKMSTKDFDQSFASFDVIKYLKAGDVPVNLVPEVVVTQPDYFVNLSKVLAGADLETIKAYFEFKAINTFAAYLDSEFVALNFDFYGKKLSGAQEMRPRWKRMLTTVNGVAGEGFGQIYVKEVFPEEAKSMLAAMIENVREVLGERITKLEWMGDDTKAKAQEKLANINVKIGYPDKWKSYADLEIDQTSFLQTIINSNKFDYYDMLNDLGKPVDKSKWGMTPQTVNAYYSPTNNEIVFPAAILQPPFYDYKADKAVNYGGIGAVIGHEITHGFDDQGRKYDANGNQNDWWTEEDGERFDALANKVVEQYDAYTVLDSVHVNGRLTLGENIADLGGVTLAYNAMVKDLEKNGRPDAIDGYSPEQRFFLSWATVWRTKSRDEALRQQVMTDPHSPGFFRAIGPLGNFPPFQEAFDLKDDAPMVRKDRIVIW